MKKVLVLALMCAVLALTGCNLKAEATVSPDQARIAKFWIGQTYYEVDGKRFEMDVAPYVKNDRTMMPARFLAYSLGMDESNVKWNEQAQTVSILRKTEAIDMQVGRTVFGVNGRPSIGHFDVGPEMVPPGRVMIPYRAVAQALGAMVFWDDAEQCVTVETWREVPPPTQQTVKKVTVNRDQNTANVVDMDGNEKQVTTNHPAMVTDPRDGGFTLDVVEWFKLWGVPDENIIYDPVRGGLSVRGASGNYPGMASGYIYFYIGEKYAWDNFFQKTLFGPDDKPGENFIQNGRLFSGGGALNDIQKVFGKRRSGPVSLDSMSVELD